MDPLDKRRFLMIHQALHDSRREAVFIDHKRIKIKQSNTGKRFLNWKGKTFVQTSSLETQTYTASLATRVPVTQVTKIDGEQLAVIINNDVRKRK